MIDNNFTAGVPETVLHLCTERTWRGGENQILHLIQGLKARGVKSLVATPGDSPAMTRLAEDAEEVIAWPGNRPKPTAIWGLRKILKRYRPSIIDCHTSKAHTLTYLASWFGAMPPVVIHRRVDYVPGKGFFNRKKYHAPVIDRYIAISNAIGAILQRYGIPMGKVDVVCSATSPAPFQKWTKQQAKKEVCEELVLNGDQPLLITPAALTEQKDIPTLLRALAVLKEQKTFKALICGEGHLRRPLEAQAKELQLEGCLRFLGFRDDIAKLLRASDVLALSSAFEGLGTTILDGIHAGCIIVATQVGGIPEMIAHRSSGFLSPVGDPQSFAANLNSALELDGDRKAQCLAKASAHIEKTFSLDAMVDGNLKVYQDVLKQRPRASAAR